MNNNITVEKRKAFRHGDLRDAFLTAGLEMARVGGPEPVILRGDPAAKRLPQCGLQALRQPGGVVGRGAIGVHLAAGGD